MTSPPRLDGVQSSTGCQRDAMNGRRDRSPGHAVTGAPTPTSQHPASSNRRQECRRGWKFPRWSTIGRTLPVHFSGSSDRDCAGCTTHDIGPASAPNELDGALNGEPRQPTSCFQVTALLGLHPTVLGTGTYYAATGRTFTTSQRAGPPQALHRLPQSRSRRR
jgi:hypothetical protein